MIRESQENQFEPDKTKGMGQNTNVTALKIQQMYNHAKESPLFLDVSKKTFDILQDLKSLRKDPQNQGIRQKVFLQLQNGQNFSLISKEQNKDSYQTYRFDVNKSYLMNKAGGIGMIERMCKFTEKGVLQFQEGKKQPKLKQVKGFTNFIERTNAKNNRSKLQWVKEQAKYPYRIVLVDKNKADKGIYFRTVQEAQAVQMFLIQKYNPKMQQGQVKKTMNYLAQKKQNQIIASFSSKLLLKLRLRKEAQRKSSSKKSNEGKKHSNQGQINKTSVQFGNINSKFNDQSFFFADRESHTHSQYYLEEKKNSLNKIQIDDSKTQANFKKNNQKIQTSKSQKSNIKFVPFELREKLERYNQKMIHQLFQHWISKVSLSSDTNQKRISQKSQKKQTKKEKNNNSVKDIKEETSLSSIMDRIQKDQSNSDHQLQEGKRSKRFLKFEKIAFDSNITAPFKPTLKINLQNKNQQQINQAKQLTFKAFQSVNKTDESFQSTYELLLDKSCLEKTSEEQGCAIQLKGKNQDYCMKITLTNMITDEVLVQREIDLKNADFLGQTFSIPLIESVMHHENIQQGGEDKSQIVCKVLGRFIQEKKDKSTTKVFNYLMNTLPLQLQSSQPHQKNINNERQENQNEKQQEEQHLKRLMTLLPVPDDQTKEEMEKLLRNSENVLEFSEVLGYVPVQNLSRLSPTDQQYRILGRAAKLLRKNNFLPFSNSYLFILRNLLTSQLFTNLTQLQQSFLGIILNWSGVFLGCEDRLESISGVLGFEYGQIDKVSQKMGVQMLVFEFILEQECPQLLEKMKRRNIPLAWLVLQYCHQLLATNLQPKLWLSILTTIFNDSEARCPQILLIFVVVYLCQQWRQELKNCYKLQEVQFILQTQTLNPLHSNHNSPLSTTHSTSTYHSLIWNYLQSKYLKYFSPSAKLNYKEELQKIRNHFYQTQSTQLQQQKQSRFAQKQTLATKFIQINQNLTIETPIYKPKPNCLHLYFVSLPKISGSLYLKTSLTEFECTDYQNNPYFVLPHLTSTVKVQFIDSKSNQYSFDLIFDIGFGFFKQQVKNSKNSSTLTFAYWAGLFEQSTLNDKYKNVKHVESSHSSFLTLSDLKYKLNKQLSQSKLIKIIQKVCSNNGRSQAPMQELGRKIKTTFSSFQNKVNEYDMFLHLLAKRKVSLKQKMYTLFQFAHAISSQLFLSQNHSIQRMILYDFMKVMQVPVNFRDFEAFYQAILFNDTQTRVPKIFKARFFFLFEEEGQIKLQNEVYNYIQQRAGKYVYSDIDIDQLLVFLKPTIIERLEQIENEKERKVQLTQGKLKLVVSSEGQVEHYEFIVKIKNNNRQFSIEDHTLPLLGYQTKLNAVIPKILSTISASVMSPLIQTQKTEQSVSMLKLSSRFKESTINLGQGKDSRLNKGGGSKMEVNQESEIVSFGEINLCRYMLAVSKRVIRLRYSKYPEEVKFRNFELFEDLNCMFLGSLQRNGFQQIKQIYVNNERVESLQFLDDKDIDLKFGHDQHGELLKYKPQIGVQNNLQLILQNQPKINKLHFLSSPKCSLNKLSAKVLINHGFGVIRWETSIIIGHFTYISTQKNKKNKKVYLILINNQEKIVQEKYIKISSVTDLINLGQITEKNLTAWQQFRC